MRNLLGLTFVALISMQSFAQVAPPKKHGDGLPTRAAALGCAIVVIQHDNTFGTGFFVSGNGDLATASHVLGDRQWSSADGKNINVTLTMPASYEIHDSAGHVFQVQQSAVEDSPESWGADVGIIHSGHKAECWLERGDDSHAQTGEHVITMGFPSLTFKSMALYEGIISAANITSGLPLGKTIQGQAVMPQNEIFRIQMPISPGISGSPLIDDDNRVIGVINAAGAWNADFDALTQLVNIRNQQRSALPNQANNRDWLDVTSELLDILHNYDSPGYGDAIPMRYLRPSQEVDPQSKTPSH